MNRFFKSFIACICLLVLFVQAGWAADEYTLTLNTQPSNAGSLNRSSGQTFAAGASVYMYCYANTDYVFDYWMSGDTIVSRDRYFYFTMPDHDATLTAVFRFDPNSPGNPDSPDQTKKYTLTLNTQPANAGSFNRSSGEQFKAGESIYMYEYNNDGFKFEKWISADTVVSTNRNFNFVMPAHDAELTAVYSYNPSSPANPDTAQVYYNVTLETQPVNAGTFSWNSTTKAVARSSCEVYAYPNSDFTFKEWQMNGETVGTDRRYRFQMPAENIRLVAVYDYTPANPSNPNKNYWNAETGEVIVDDFTAGNLSSAVNNTIGGSNNRDKVQMITVAGPVSQYDWGVVNNYSNCTYLDMSRTYGMTYVPSYNFSNNTTLTTVSLPSSIERIEYYAFHNCSNLSSISIYAATPPTIGNRAFEGIGDSIVYVPADALALYQEAEGWKDFTILPLAKEVSALEINLPEGTDPSIYKDMYIELINTKSGQKQRYVITNRTTYTFNSLIHRTSYNVYLKNAQGDVLGEIDGIDIVDHDVSMTFESLKVPRDLTLKVLIPGGEDVTGQTTITWMDAKDTYLTKGNTLTGQMEGAYAKFHITLPQTLGMQYLLPKDSVYEVLAENDISITLKAIPQTTISGKVTDIKKGQPLSGATVAVSQKLNGLYSKSFTTKTDNKGEWSLQVYEAKTDVTASMSDYVSKTQSFETPITEIPAFELKDISGTTISLNLTYTTTDGETQNYYSDYADVAYTVFDETMQEQVTEMNVQYPKIVLMEQLAEGTQLTITATSKNQKFVPVTATATVDEKDIASVTLPIVQLGGITATFKQTDNNNIVGILYDKNDRLIKKYDYSGTSLTISELSDGEYTLVTMANSQFFNSVGTVSQFAEAGLRVGVDFIKNKVTVQSGAYTSINNQVIPYLDETKFYYTGDNTSFTANKSQVTAGQYLTLRGQVSFKSIYADDISDVKLVVDLPDNCAFVDNSVLVGKSVASYTINESTLVVPLEDITNIVKFCVIPVASGDFMPCAKVRFNYRGKEIVQPIGWGYSKVISMTINVPEETTTSKILVSGNTISNSQIKVFDNGILIGETKSLANGSWNGVFDLSNSYDFTYHAIRAEIVTTNGISYQTDSKKVFYNSASVEPIRITMNNYYNTIVMDLLNPSKSLLGYTFVPSYNDFTFKVDMNNKHSKDLLSSVDVYVTTSNGEVQVLPASYDENKDSWIALSKFNTTNLPISVSAHVSMKETNVSGIDASLVDTLVNNYQTIDLAEMFKTLDELDKKGEFDISIDTVEYNISAQDNIRFIRRFVCKGEEGSDFTLMNSFISEDFTEEEFQQIVDEYLCVKDTKGRTYYLKNINEVSCIGTICLDKENMKRVSFLFYAEDTSSIQEILSRRSMVGNIATGVGVVATAAGLFVTAPAWGVALAGVGLVAGVVGAYDAYKDLRKVDEEFNTYEDCLREKGLYDSYRKRYNKATGADVFGNVFGVSTAKYGLLASAVKAPASVGRAFGVVGLFFTVPAVIGGYQVGKVGDDIKDNCGEKKPDPEDPKLKPYIDPSGYVYEAVSSNRIQGVTASCYYMETVEDMYGDLHENVVLWNAEEYAQENPLFTDEYGMYQWDVPQGLWQVKFEKEGYQTTYSEWLPVPPPQLEVNIPMTQLLQPTVKSGKAYSEGVEMEFDKYMDPETLTTDNIKVTKNGNAVSGTIELLNEEVAYEGKTETFASKVRFNVPEGEELLSTDEVQLTVKKAVKSYAGVQMQDDYVQKFDVEPRVRLMAVDSLINVGYGAERTITVAALPADASKGKKVNVKSLSTMIASVDNEELTLDENGQAELKVSGELPGSTVLSYTMEDSDVEGLTTVNVKDAALLVTIAPRASRVSGTQVYRGTKVQLSSETEGAVIYYTLDGSCPCNSETAIKYDADAPIVINDDNVTIKAIAQGHDLAESEVAEFNYSLKTTTLGYTLPIGWTWISHNEETAVPVTEFQTGAERIVSQTQELVNDPVAGFIGSLTELQPVVGYKVKQATEGNVRLSGYEWDATKQAVAVETGWNWIGYPVNQIMTVAEALAFFTPSEGDYLVGQNGFVEYADGEWKGTLEGMKPGEGFLYKSGAATEIPFNTTIVSTAGNRAFKRSVLVGSPWAANSRTYPNIMPMTAQLYDNGIRTSDGEYIVGAFVGTECRGVGQWKDDRLMMNINGTGGEELSFMAYNPQTEQMFNINETFKFTADNQGSWHQPCMLTIGSEATGISVSNLSGDFTVTPLVARDHITVTAGGNDINYLTLTDMSGRIVTSLRDLGTGATVTISTLPEGVYIVTAQAGGQTHYRKIVKSKN